MISLETVSRYIFLVFVLLLSVYFMYASSCHNKIEKYTEVSSDAVTKAFSQIVGRDPTPTELTSLSNAQSLADLKTRIQSEIPLSDSKKVQITGVIIDIYAQKMQKVPSSEEIDFYYNYAVNNTASYQKLTDVIMNSANTVKKAYENPVVYTDSFGTENTVIKVYNEILDRNPDPSELKKYATRIKDGKLSEDQLRDILYASLEYKRLEKTQTNMVNASIHDNMTDRQLTFIVTEDYRTIAGRNADLDDDTLKFLKKKLMQFNLDRNKFRQFIKNYMAGDTFERQVALQQKIVEEAAEVEKQKEALRKDGERFCSKPNNKVIKDLLSSKSVFDTINQQATCVFDTSIDSLGNQSLSSAINDRNRQELKDICQRNTTYSKIDEDMVVLKGQEWSVPQKHPPVCIKGDTTYQPSIDQTALIGTLLDAK